MKYGIGAIAALLAATIAYSGAASAVEANPADLAQADKFLKDLPKSCGSSSKSVDADGAVSIRIKCDGNGKKMDGLVSIKDGIVTRVE